jgi:Na+-transporting NADH:ubiquinone oxidoreductase subunit NqrD
MALLLSSFFFLACSFYLQLLKCNTPNSYMMVLICIRNLVCVYDQLAEKFVLCDQNFSKFITFVTVDSPTSLQIT